jgi:1-deoxy-D-xylulose-5-phosphate synthase
VVQRGHDVLLCALGTTVQTAVKAAAEIKATLNLSCTVIDARFAKPLDEDLFVKEAAGHSLVCSIEDHCLAGGFGSALLELFSDRRVALHRPLIRVGIADEFVSHGTQAEQKTRFGITPSGIVAAVSDAFEMDGAGDLGGDFGAGNRDGERSEGNSKSTFVGGVGAVRATR